jgi:phospholipid-transporting ATPase
MGGLTSLLVPPKPPGSPRNWPNSTAAEIAQLPNKQVYLNDEQEYSFCDNFVKTSKYEWFNFLPKFLFEEFNPALKPANVYFLIISFLQVIPAITNTNGIPTTLTPLFFVVMGDLVIMLREDLARHKADKEANSSIAYRLAATENVFEPVLWSKIYVGDIIRLDSRCTVPADVLILGVCEKTSPPQGICYVDTKSLDGETNLKMRNALPLTLGTVSDIASLRATVGVVEMEHPNKLIDNFSGTIEIDGLGKDPILPSNVLLRGCVLRNVDYIYGLIINSGHDTKIMRSTTSTKAKSSALESATTQEVKRVVLLLALICFIGATGGVIWNRQYGADEAWYLRLDDTKGKYWIIQFFYFFLLHATFVPVSLYISMTMVRLFQSVFMNADLEMYYAKTDTPALVRTMPLNEELGQISHIFSDKTGTLTCNIMNYRKSSIGGVVYGLGITAIGKASWKLQGKDVPAAVLEGEERARQNAVPHVSFYDPQYDKDMASNGPAKKAICNFFRVISLCHDVIAERVDGKVKLSASNPDDEALVCAAAYFGFEFRDNRDNKAVIFNKEQNKEEVVEILDVIEFSSKRKRMSVIARDPDGKIRLYCKGADSVMVDRVWPGQTEMMEATELHMKQFAEEGLRCLLVGFCEIDEDNYLAWHAQYKTVCADLGELDKKKDGHSNRIEDMQDSIERNLTMLGCTAIEDCLQDDVPECIANLAAAGIKLWVLTGDKEETAINIAVACNLVLPKQYMRHVVINKATAETKDEMIAIFRAENELLDEDTHKLGERVLPRALIIDGSSLLVAMADLRGDGVRAHLLQFSQRCRAVVGCRVSPDQKREMVNLIKTGVPGVRTLSIGDGANDVAMIQEAHVGVGIRGEEGLQAVNASDYAIAQFSYLQVLLLKHGRSNYIRMSNLVCYTFYKNIFMSSCNFWFAWVNGVSGKDALPMVATCVVSIDLFSYFLKL